MTTVADCPCSGKSLPRLTRPAIMAMLARQQAHGYEIAQQLAAMRIFEGREPDHPGIYRTLKEMTDEGLVTATWQTGDTGPARRIFTLTDAGRQCLETWLTTLRDYRDAINQLLAQLRRAQQ